MRIALPLLVLFTAACSSTRCLRCEDPSPRSASVFLDTDADGLPDARAALGDLDGRHTESVFFIDTDDDGLPDNRRVQRRGESARDRNELSGEARIDRALERLERAIAEVRRSMR